MHANSTPFELDDTDKDLLHRAACRLIHGAVGGTPADRIDVDLGVLADLQVVGVFVTLRKAGQLRGCIGNFTESIRLAEALQRAAVGAATGDPRFPPVTAAELPALSVELSLLHSRELLGPSPDVRRLGIEIGRHGLDLQRGGRKGLLLPQVAVEWHWDTSQFLEAVCRKASLPSDAWQDPAADLYRFEATCFGGPCVGEEPH